MQYIRSDGFVRTAIFHELMSLKESSCRDIIIPRSTLAPSRLLMQSLIGRRPCGSIRLRQPYGSPIYSLLGSLIASRRPPKPKNILGRPHASVATARDVWEVITYILEAASIRTSYETRGGCRLVLPCRYPGPTLQWKPPTSITCEKVSTMRSSSRR